jgi:hypothetical protein
MTEAARPDASRPPGSVGAGVRAGLQGGLLAFAVATLLGVAVGLIEFAASGGAYRLWTWVKVGFLYVVSFCTAGLRVSGGVRSEGGDRLPVVIYYRFPLLLGTVLLLWLLVLAGRKVGRGEGVGAIGAGAGAAVLGFAAPVFAVSLPATLRFPGLAHAQVSPVLWQAVAFPAVMAVTGVGVGVLLERRERLPAPLVAIVRGGWRMFVLSLTLAFVGFLALAAVEVGPTGAYAREMQSEGRVGVLSVTHHLLLLPNQSLWILAPSMGGSTTLSFGPGGRSEVAIGRGKPDPEAIEAADRGVPGPTGPLGGGYYLFLLVPAVATVLGGRRAGRAGSDVIRRLGFGAGAGVVFAFLVAAGEWASDAAIPIPALGWAPVSIRAAMPSTALLALGWGVLGGMLGALTAPIGAAPAAQPEGVPEPG